MKYRVDLRYSHIIYDEKDYDKAFALYESEGIRLIKMKNIYDDPGEIIFGLPHSSAEIPKA